MSERMLSFFSRKDRLCRHVHLSMQSLSDKIIERMGRSYRSREVELLIKKLGSLVPGIAITGDLIAGFPGESDSDHLFTASLLKKLPMAGLHVFPFSARKGTRACSMEGFLDSRVIKARAFELRDIAKKLRGRYLESQKGMVVDAIVTSDEGDIKKEVEAFSDNAISISLPKGTVKYGAMAPVRIDFVSEKKVRGTWC
jgi:threonylcarbamoyladenosine tRNA methylthiotransferase MtaB